MLQYKEGFLLVLTIFILIQLKWIKVALGLVSNGYFVFPFQISLRQLPHTHRRHAGKIEPLVADGASGLSLILFHEQYIYCDVYTHC
jgi:hypothetical protein